MNPRIIGAAALWLGLTGAHAQEAGPAAPVAPPGADAVAEPGFDVFEYRVEGTTLLPVISVEQAVYPHLGEKKTLADVEKARAALEKAYHSAGYLTVLVSIPQQKVEGGVVRLSVTEAPVDRLRVVDSRYFSLDEIKAAAPQLAEGNVPYFPQMQKELAALNKSADRRVTPVLRPGKTPGTVEVDLKVKDALPLHGEVELNDRYSQDTSRTRLSASMRWDNLWQKQHGIGVALQTAPEAPGESRVLSLNYTWPLASGNYLAFYGVKSDSAVAAVGTLNVRGNGTILGARYIVPLRGRDAFFHSTTLGVDYKNFQQSVALVDGGSFDTPIRYLPFVLSWDGTWLGERSRTRVGASFNFHLRGLVADDAAFAEKRFKGRTNYSFLRGTYSHEQTSQSGWKLEARGGWQIAAQPLISNEQFAIGGADTVRGYLESAALGENGVSLSLEAHTPNLARYVAEAAQTLHVLAFVDGGYVSVREPITAERRFALAGTGLGIRFKAARGVSGGLDWAVALRELGRTERGDSRAHFRLGIEW